MDEFDLTRELQKLLTEWTDQKKAERVLRFLTDWNKSRPLPPAGVL